MSDSFVGTFSKKGILGQIAEDERMLPQKARDDIRNEMWQDMFFFLFLQNIREQVKDLPVDQQVAAVKAKVQPFVDIQLAQFQDKVGVSFMEVDVKGETVEQSADDPFNKMLKEALLGKVEAEFTGLVNDVVARLLEEALGLSVEDSLKAAAVGV